jgi:cell division protein FtsI (penicillin-binding protein 3)
LGLAINLFRLQVVDAAFLQTQAQQQQIISLKPFVPRRPIVDRLGNVLAIDRPAFSLYAHPILFEKTPTDVAMAIAPLLNRPINEIETIFSKGDSGLEVEYALPEDVAGKIQALGISGLELVGHQQRFYPQQDLFANILGYVDIDQQGQAGIELTLQDQLKRSIEDIKLSRTGNGNLLPDRVTENFFQGDNLRLQLSLDSRLQRAARSQLKKQLAQYEAKRGTILVMDVYDGSIRVLVSEPSYDANRYNQADYRLFRNWAVSDLYEPGSTFKPINVAIALEDGAVTPNDVFYDEGEIFVGGWPIRNFDYQERGGRGNQTVTEIIQNSSNVGMVHIMRQVKPDVYYHWLEKIGIDQPTGVDLPAEASGQLKDFEQFTQAPVEPATTAFGQGFALTPLKLLQLHASLANGGRLVTPHVVDGLIDRNGALVWKPELSPSSQLFSSETTQKVMKMMETVIREGTGKVAQIPGYHIAGKTGTAQKANPNGGYLEQARITSFVSIFPANAPRYVTLVVVDEPQGDDAYGSTVAAPIAKSVMESLIGADKLMPSEPIEQNLELLDNRSEEASDTETTTDTNNTDVESSEQDHSQGWEEEYFDEYPAEEYETEPEWQEPAETYYEDDSYEEPSFEDNSYDNYDTSSEENF